MLIRIDRLSGPDGRKLMDLYREGNLENAEYFYPEITDREAGIRKVEEEFLRYIREDFLKKEGNAYYVLEADSVWVSALRLYRVKEGLYNRRREYPCFQTWDESPQQTTEQSITDPLIIMYLCSRITSTKDDVGGDIRK